MTRNESDREDLIREAVALPERTELRVAGFDEPVTIGFRANSAMSVFIGQDPVYQFDPDSRLRRAYVDGFLYRSQLQTLAQLQRVRTDSETQLLRHDLTADELAAFRELMVSRLRMLHCQMTSGLAIALRTVPEQLDLLPKIVIALSSVIHSAAWLSPEIRRRQ